jgi:hypothetical protein
MLFAEEQGAFTSVGQSGISPQFSLQLSETWNARFGMERFSHPWGLGGDEQGYNLTADDGLGSAFLDWRPAGSGFRVSGGVLRGSELISVSPNLTGGGFVGPLNLDVAAEPWQTAPYLGIGWDSAAQVAEPGWNFKLDLGVMLTGASKADASPDSGASSLAPSFSNDQGDGGQGLGSGIGEIGQYPVLSIGARYRW